MDWFSPIERLYPSCGIGSSGSKSMMIWLGVVSYKWDKSIHLTGLKIFWNNWATNSSDFELCFRVMAVIELRSSSPPPATIEMGFGIIWIILLDEFIFWTWELQLKNKIIIQGNVLILLMLKFIKAIKYLLFKIFFSHNNSSINPRCAQDVLSPDLGKESLVVTGSTRAPQSQPAKFPITTQLHLSK